MNTIRFATLSRCARVIAGLTGFALVAAAGPLWGAVSSRVEVRGAQFIPEADIQRTCGVEAGVPYSDAELRDIEACLMSTAVFERVSLYRESDALIIDVVELDTRPGRLSGALFYDFRMMSPRVCHMSVKTCFPASTARSKLVSTLKSSD